jgi:hypothetical protein
MRIFRGAGGCSPSNQPFGMSLYSMIGHENSTTAATRNRRAGTRPASGTRPGNRALEMWPQSFAAPVC